MAVITWMGSARTGRVIDMPKSVTCTCVSVDISIEVMASRAAKMKCLDPGPTSVKPHPIRTTLKMFQTTQSGSRMAALVQKIPRLLSSFGLDVALRAAAHE
mmetsp:Transcript_46981/g.130874  ORF Transcript_46981/g.130874 Transcript_46981/m.130874 type:complete len:101 (+) Transcript_46981:493-795(+)